MLQFTIFMCCMLIHPFIRRQTRYRHTDPVCAMKAGWEACVTSFILNLGIKWSMWPASLSGRFATGERKSDTHSTEVCVGPRVGLNAVVTR